MDNELLKRVLTENSRIIIPGFGVFLHKEQNDALIFNPFLRRDDGKLVAILEMEYGVSAQDAKTMIDEFSDRIRNVLKVKSKYYIDGLGELVVDNNGVISFVAQTTPIVEPTRASPTTPLATLQAQRSPMPEMVTPRSIVAPPQQAQPSQQPMAPQYVQQSKPQQQYVAMQPEPLSVASTPSPAPLASVPQPSSQSPFSRPLSAQAKPSPRPIPSPVVVAPVASPVVSTQNNVTPARPQVPRPTNGVQSNRRAPQPQQRSPRPIKKSKKGDMWLVIAIIAAAVVIVLMVIGIMNSSQLAAIKIP